jgi:hypothetical protein
LGEFGHSPILPDHLRNTLLERWNLQPQSDGFRVLINPAKSAVSQWVYTSIPEKTRISFTIKIDDFQTVNNVYGSLVFGFGTANNEFLNGDFLVYRVIQAGSHIYIYFGDPFTLSPNPIPQIQLYPEGTPQQVILVIDRVSLEILLDGNRVVGPRSLSTEERQLFWIGFRLPQTGVLDATISDFRIEEIIP